MFKKIINFFAGDSKNNDKPPAKESGTMIDVYKANETLIDGYEWLATLDNHVCLSCAVLDGTVYKSLDDMPMSLHKGCRCLALPKMKSWRELGIDIDDLEEVARPWALREWGQLGKSNEARILKHGKFQGSFGEWWKTLPEKDQDDIVGYARARLLRQGEIAWAGMVSRETGKIYTLQELGFDIDESLGIDMPPREKPMPKPKSKPKTPSKTKQSTKTAIKEIITTRKSKVDNQCEELGIPIQRIEIPFNALSKKWICGRSKPKKVEHAVVLWLNKQEYKGTFYEILPIEMMMQASCLGYVAEKSQSLFNENYLARSFTDQIDLYKLDKSICHDLILNADDSEITNNLDIILGDSSIKQWHPFLKKDDIVFLLKSIDRSLYMKIVDHIFIDPQSNRNGFPDIFAFKDGELSLFEVKTNDSLLDTQIRTYHNFIKPHGMSMQVIKVSKGKG